MNANERRHSTSMNAHTYEHGRRRTCTYKNVRRRMPTYEDGRRRIMGSKRMDTHVREQTHTGARWTYGREKTTVQGTLNSNRVR